MSDFDKSVGVWGGGQKTGWIQLKREWEKLEALNVLNISKDFV